MYAFVQCLSKIPNENNALLIQWRTEKYKYGGLRFRQVQ